MAELLGGSVQQGVLSCTDTFTFPTCDIHTLGPDVFNYLHAFIQSVILFIYIYMCVCMCVCVSVCIYIYIYIYIYIFYIENLIYP